MIFKNKTKFDVKILKKDLEGAVQGRFFRKLSDQESSS